MAFRSRYVPPAWAEEIARKAIRARAALDENPLLYFTTDPAEVPIVMPMWARSVPELAAKIDEGLKRRAEFPYTDAERARMRP